jgi:hypothetical protein
MELNFRCVFPKLITVRRKQVFVPLVLPHLDGYDALREASVRQGLFRRPFAKSAGG